VATVIALVWLSVAGASVFFEEKFEKIKERNGGEFKFEVVTSDEKEEMDEDMEEALKDLEEELKNLEDNNLIDSSTTKIIKRVAKKTAKRVRDKAISDSEKQKVIVITGGEDTIKIKTDIE
jgi:predicted RND superfamily exporter protein